MSRTYRPKYFVLQEYVPPAIYQKWGETAWEFIDERLLMMDDLLREKFGPMVINTWHSPALVQKYGLREWSGLRTPDSPFYSPTSQHCGRASDKLLVRGSVDAAREYIISNPYEFPLIGGIELKVPWLHTDVRSFNGIKQFSA